MFQFLFCHLHDHQICSFTPPISSNSYLKLVFIVPLHQFFLDELYFYYPMVFLFQVRTAENFIENLRVRFLLLR